MTITFEPLHESHFDWCIIDQVTDNLNAIKAFTKDGFKIFEQFQENSNT